MKDNDLIIRN